MRLSLLLCRYYDVDDDVTNTLPCTNVFIAQLAGAVEYTDCFSTEGYDPPPNECPRYDTKQSDGEVLVMLEL